MATLNSQITALLRLGADAMDNLYDVNIVLPAAVMEAINADNAPGLTSVDNTISKAVEHSFGLRCQGFTPPKFTQKTYDIRYKTISLKKPAARIDGDRSFQLQFRLDAYYNVYRALMAWRSRVMQPSTGYASNLTDDPDATASTTYLGTIYVTALDSPLYQAAGEGYNFEGMTSGNFSQVTPQQGGLNWTFNSVWITDLDNPVFKTGAGEIQMINATFAFGEYMDPQIIDYQGGSSEPYGILPTT